jgi:serine protease inhibitor
MHELNDGVLNLGLQMFHAIVPRTENGVVAPTCAATLLGVLCLGGRAVTRMEILNVLTNRKDIDQRLQTSYEYEFARRLRSLDACRGFSHTNKLFVTRCSSRIAASFQRKAASYSSTSCAKIPSSEDREGCSRIINDWIKRETGGKIPSIVSSQFLCNKPSITAVSALMFHSRWMCPFERSTNKISFTTLEGRQVAVNGMVSGTRLRCSPTP